MARYGYDPLQQLSQRQVHKRVRGQIDPYLASGHRAIQAYTEALARALQPAAAQTQAIYGRATQEQAAIDQALANRLSGAGGAAQADLAQQLGQAGQSQAPAQAVGQVGTGAANAGYASGSAALSRLTAQGAAAGNYAGNLPNIARLGGAQQEQQYRAELLSQLPKLTQAEEDRNFQRAVAAQSGLIQGTRLQQQASQFSQRQSQQQQQFQTREQRQASQFDTQTQLALDRIGLSKAQLGIAHQRERRLAAGKKGASGGFTPSQIAKLRSSAIETVKGWKHGYVDKKGNHVPASSGGPRAAFRFLVLHGIPPSMADWATGQVYGKWKAPGERGGKRGRGGSGPR